MFKCEAQFQSFGAKKSRKRTKLSLQKSVKLFSMKHFKHTSLM